MNPSSILLFTVILLTAVFSCAKRIDPTASQFRENDIKLDNDLVKRFSSMKKPSISGVLIADQNHRAVCKDAVELYFGAFDRYSNLSFTGYDYSEEAVNTSLKMLSSGGEIYFEQICTLNSLDNNKDFPVYEVSLKTAYFKTDSKRLVTSDEREFSNSKDKESIFELGNFITNYFPKRGFILSTFENRQFAKILLGHNDNVRPGDKLRVRKTEYKNFDPDSRNPLELKFVVNYSADILFESEILFVEENESWISIDEEFRNKVVPGYATFLFVD